MPKFQSMAVARVRGIGTVRPVMARHLAKSPTNRMNQTEAWYSLNILGRLIVDSIVASFVFQGIKLRLADDTFYTPDFAVFMADGTIELHEVKGTWKAPHQDDSRVKIKVAAEQYPQFRFTSWEKKTSRREWFGPHGAADWDKSASK